MGVKFTTEFILLSILKFEQTASIKIIKNTAGFSMARVDLMHDTCMHMVWDLVCGAVLTNGYDEKHFPLNKSLKVNVP